MLQSLCLHFVCLLRCLGDVAVIYSFFLVHFIFDILFLEMNCILKICAALAKSGPLDFPSEKTFFNFLPMNRV